MEKQFTGKVSQMNNLHEKANYLYCYNPLTGIFTHRNPANRRIIIGSQAGSKSNGHIALKIDGKSYQAHRIAWLLTYGKMPNGILDHVNLDGMDNRICNLRECSHSQNNYNHYIQKRNQTGYKGVFKLKETGRYKAYITVDKKRITLGHYDCPIEASKIVEAKRLELHKQFARIK